MAKDGLAEGNPNITNGDGGIACRATQKGIECVAANTAVNTQAEAPKTKGNTKMSFEIEDVALPASKRGGATRSSKYPFDVLEVGQSFFVANTEKHPDMVKSMASAVTNAMKKYDVADIDEATGVQKTKIITVPKTGEKRTINAMKHTRIFGIRPDTKDGVAGARIGRTA